VVYNSVDIDRFAPTPTQAKLGSQDLLAVGNLIPTKGQDLIMKAMARLALSFPQLACRFIGEGPDRARLESLSRKLGIAQRVQLLGRRGRAEVADAMRACSVFVLPSSSEGLGCVYLEAMACAKPVIGCRGQGIEEVIEQGRNGWLIPTNGLAELVEALSTLLQSRELSLQMGQAARESILSRLTVSHQAQALAGIYREAIGRK
jgi:glycosyltransferase involved in cell wall biosynthesis